MATMEGIDSYFTGWSEFQEISRVLHEVTEEDEIPHLLTLIPSSFLSDTGPQSRGGG